MTVAARRAHLCLTKPSDPVANAGLELNRYLLEQSDGRVELLDRIGRDAAPAVYTGAYERWLGALDTMPDVVLRPFEVKGRMIAGLGSESVLESAITLQRLYGVPFIPGSALKGLAHRYARKVLLAGGTLNAGQMRLLFGAQQSAGYLTWFDAWWIPPADGGAGDRPLARDVITVHHRRYYMSRGNDQNGPWDFDDPVLNPFISARGCYLIALRAPSLRWGEYALLLLTRALADWGIGAKTSSGYGRLEPVGKPRLSSASPRAQQRSAALASRLQTLETGATAPQPQAGAGGGAATVEPEKQGTADLPAAPAKAAPEPHVPPQKPPAQKVKPEPEIESESEAERETEPEPPGAPGPPEEPPGPEPEPRTDENLRLDMLALLSAASFEAQFEGYYRQWCEKQGQDRLKTGQALAQAAKRHRWDRKPPRRLRGDARLREILDL